MFPKLSKLLLLFLGCVTMFATVPAFGLDEPTEGTDSIRELSQNINKLLGTSVLKGASIGIQIVSLNSGEVVYEYHPELGLNPASNTKLITSAVALVKLKPEYQFTTTVYTNATVQNGVISGDVYLRGGGDPVLSYEHLLRLAQDVYNAGVRVIIGNIVGDDSFFDEQREISGWNDFKHSYSGKISALSLNNNIISLIMKPALRSGMAPQIIIDPPTSYVQVKNQAVTLATTKNRLYVSFLRPKDSSPVVPVQESLVVQGKISIRSRYGVPAHVYINNPSLFTTATFKHALEQMGITVKGTVASGQIPKKALRMAVYTSEPLSRIICDSNKMSNNFVAEQILKTLGAEIKGAPGTTAKGLQVIQEFLAELDILPNTYTLENGSGLSLNNRLSPAQIVTLLTYMYENFEVRAEYLASLAIAGVDGTLQRRLRDTQAERRLRAKTGAIRNVSCLSGYAASKDNEIFVFSILINGYKSGGHAVQNIQNQIGLLLTEFYRPTYNARNMKSDEGYDRNRRRAFR
jgi:D-alanyl-D-alanine carboxypeptidase/D-alanyl-D-alanine-endopeptidase (penicillin-binding protein 4)